jgi:hypothetical protein
MAYGKGNRVVGRTAKGDTVVHVLNVDTYLADLAERRGHELLEALDFIGPRVPWRNNLQ